MDLHSTQPKNTLYTDEQVKQIVIKTVKKEYPKFRLKIQTFKSIEELVTCISTSQRNKKNIDENKIPRPQNSFLLFRKDFSAKNHKIFGRVKDISNKAAEEWSKLDLNQKSFWQDLSKLAKEIHEIVYPNYKFQPKFKKKDSDDNNNLRYDPLPSIQSNALSQLRYYDGNFNTVNESQIYNSNFTLQYNDVVFQQLNQQNSEQSHLSTLATSVDMFSPEEFQFSDYLNYDEISSHHF